MPGTFGPHHHRIRCPTLQCRPVQPRRNRIVSCCNNQRVITPRKYEGLPLTLCLCPLLPRTTGVRGANGTRGRRPTKPSYRRSAQAHISSFDSRQVLHFGRASTPPVQQAIAMTPREPLCCPGPVSAPPAGRGVLGRRRKAWLASALLSIALASCGGGAGQVDNAQSAASPAPSPSATPSPAPITSQTSAATLRWTASADTRVQGYRVYYGVSSRTYAQSKGAGIDVGGSVSHIAGSLQTGRTYYFAVTAYDGVGNESDYSAEVSKVVQ